MNGELAQVIALITHGNEFLNSSQREAPELFSSNSTFQYVSDVSFKRATTKFGFSRKQEVIAHDTRTWFEGQRNAGVKGFRLAFVQLHLELPQQVAVAFAGGGNWAIQADAGRTTELWRVKWSVKDQHHPQRRIWSVEYWGFANYPAQTTFPKVDEAAKELEVALSIARSFSEKAGLDVWGGQFMEAIDLLSHASPTIPYHPDILPAGFQDLSCRQLVASACKAWVFGGMGSWNDMSFENASLQKDYEFVTARLYQAVMNAFSAVTNSST